MRESVRYCKYLYIVEMILSNIVDISILLIWYVRHCQFKYHKTKADIDTNIDISNLGYNVKSAGGKNPGQFFMEHSLLSYDISYSHFDRMSLGLLTMSVYHMFHSCVIYFTFDWTLRHAKIGNSWLMLSTVPGLSNQLPCISFVIAA